MKAKNSFELNRAPHYPTPDYVLDITDNDENLSSKNTKHGAKGRKSSFSEEREKLKLRQQMVHFLKQAVVRILVTKKLSQFERKVFEWRERE